MNMEKTQEPLLRAANISVSFGGVKALRDVSLQVSPGERLGLIGPNGAGKTTFFNALTGFAPVESGEMAMGGEAITSWSPQRRFKAGIARTFQIPEVVTEATVLDNVLLGFRRGRGTSLAQQVLRTPAYRRREHDARSAALEVLDKVGLSGAAHRTAGQLPLGQIRLLELARCLLSEPKLLLLDELASGLTVEELDPLERALDHAREAGQAVVLVEHNVSWVMRLVDRVHVLDQGQTLASGSPAVIRNDDSVIQAYLGTKYARTA